jgi:CHAT domain-containing protein
VALLAFAAGLNGCHSAAPLDPASLYQHIHRDLLHGNLDLAQQDAEKARVDFAASSPEWAMRFRLLEADILTYQGRRPKVLDLLENPGVAYPVDGDEAIKRDLLRAMADARQGKPHRADTELAEARSLAQKTRSPLTDELLRAEAVVQMSRSHWTEAADLSRKSLNLARDQRDSFIEAQDLFNLGMVAFEMRHYDESLALLNEAVTFAKPIQARLVLEAAFGTVGAAYYELGDFEKALANFQQAEQQSSELGITSGQAEWLWDEGSSYYELGRFAEAKRCFEQSLKVALALDNREEIVGIHTDLAFLLLEQGQADAARTHSEEAIRIARASADTSGTLKPLFLQALLLARQPDTRPAESMLLELHRQCAQDPSLQAQLESALGKLYAGKRQTAQADRWFRQSIQTFEEQRSTIQEEELRLPFFANSHSLYLDYAAFLIASQKQQQALQVLDLGRAKTLAEGLGSSSHSSAAPPPAATDMQAVARRLKGVILFYSLGREKSYLWAVTPHATRLFPLPAQAEIKAMVDGYQKAILRSADPVRDQDQQARDLYDTLVSPAADLIPLGAHVFVIPDGALNQLNFETMLAPGGGGPHYWIEDVTVSSASSIRLLSRVAPAFSANHSGKLLLFGDPVAAGTGYGSLVNAAAELQDVERHFPPGSQTVITRFAAIPAAYAENRPDQFRFIHFVAHGTASQLSPLDSAVILSPPPGDPAGFKLYARDIMRCPLHAELVTISACYGSGLRAYAGEGMVGLSWAFLRAGAHNVIGALWAVNDASTPLLMDRLYGELEAGRTPEEALRNAKLSLIHSPAVYRKPLYWGALQLYTGS